MWQTRNPPFFGRKNDEVAVFFVEKTTGSDFFRFLSIPPVLWAILAGPDPDPDLAEIEPVVFSTEKTPDPSFFRPKKRRGRRFFNFRTVGGLFRWWIAWW